jgi:hypothetical protein
VGIPSPPSWAFEGSKVALSSCPGSGWDNRARRRRRENFGLIKVVLSGRFLLSKEIFSVLVVAAECLEKTKKDVPIFRRRYDEDQFSFGAACDKNSLAIHEFWRTIGVHFFALCHNIQVSKVQEQSKLAATFLSVLRELICSQSVVSSNPGIAFSD